MASRGYGRNGWSGNSHEVNRHTAILNQSTVSMATRGKAGGKGKYQTRKLYETKAFSPVGTREIGAIESPPNHHLINTPVLNGDGLRLIP